MIAEDRVIEELERLLAHEKFNENPKCAVEWFIKYKIAILSEENSNVPYKIRKKVFSYLNTLKLSLDEIKSNITLEKLIEYYIENHNINIKDEDINEIISLYQKYIFIK